MSCKKCCGLVVEDHGEWRCLNCGCRPFETRITVKGINPDCFAMPELNGYCAPCWHSRKRNPLTESEKAKAYRERMRLKQQKRRAKLKEAASDVHTTVQSTERQECSEEHQERAPLPECAIYGLASGCADAVAGAM